MTEAKEKAKMAMKRANEIYTNTEEILKQGLEILNDGKDALDMAHSTPSEIRSLANEVFDNLTIIMYV